MVEIFSIRNIICDHYLTQVHDFNSDRFGHLKGLLPIIRIFGIVEETGILCPILNCSWEFKVKNAVLTFMEHFRIF